MAVDLNPRVRLLTWRVEQQNAAGAQSDHPLGLGTLLRAFLGEVRARAVSPQGSVEIPGFEVLQPDQADLQPGERGGIGPLQAGQVGQEGIVAA